MSNHARLYEQSIRGPEYLRAVRGALGTVDIRFDRGECADRGSVGIILFDTVDDFALGAARDASRRGADRVLAVQLSADCENCLDHWRMLRSGATDVVYWSADPGFLRNIAQRLQRWQEIDAILESPVVRNNLVGTSPCWRAALRQVIETARYGDAAILITGESGTGKELIARLIHTLDPRLGKTELVVLDCTTIVPELSGSELFGHERGAFTGAVIARDGAFAMAKHGTLFLDEVGELPAALQAQLLRVIQEHMYKRVGGNQWLRTEFRLICATNRNLQAEVASGTFRSDLFYRIASCTCELPPLRQRTEDILPLAQYFLVDAAGGTAVPQLTSAVRDCLLRRSWPGNVRELRQLMVQIRARHVGAGPITPGDLPPEERPDTAAQDDWLSDEFERAIHQAVCRGVKLKELSQYATETAIRLVVREEGGNLQRAARRLGVTDRALQLRRAQGLPRLTH